MTLSGPIELRDGAIIAVVGGGPSGSFFAIQLLRKARELNKKIKVNILERRWASGLQADPCCKPFWKGCNYCAGVISPNLADALKALNFRLPEELIQCRIQSITIQNFWKNIELEVPSGREILSVFRGSRPATRMNRCFSLDAFLLEEALTAGASVLNGEVVDMHYASNGKPVVQYRVADEEHRLEADLMVFAAGVNEKRGMPACSPALQGLQRLIPDFKPPRLRRALVCELEAKPKVPENLANTVHFAGHGSKNVRLEMCSLVPKQGFITVVLVGPSVDAATHCADHRAIAKHFLELPHIRKLLPANIQLSTCCVCAPNMVIGSARNPCGHRVAAVGDIVTARLYKDGILSAYQTAGALAEAALTRGVDTQSLKLGYEPTLRRFRKNNRFAALVFFIHRVFSGSSVLSRILYQAMITERKNTPVEQRHLEKILWRIASGDDEYENIFWSMIHPATVWLILTGGMAITLRNYATELLFGLCWEGIGRFTTGVAFEKLEAKRCKFSRLMATASVKMPAKLEFERMYTVKIRASRHNILWQTGQFGETDRGYLRPRWLRIQRIAGTPNSPGCVIRYELLGRYCCNLILEQVVGGHLAVYRIRDGYAQGGVLIFEIEELAEETCALSIYVAFDFTRGKRQLTKPFWWLFRQLFPAYVHDVLWNHSLCQIKNILEASDQHIEEIQPDLQKNLRLIREQVALPEAPGDQL